MGTRLRWGFGAAAVGIALVVACGEDLVTPGDASDGGAPGDAAGGGDGAAPSPGSTSDGGPGASDGQASDAGGDADGNVPMVEELRLESQMVSFPGDAGTVAWFGTGVAIDGDRAVVGASGEQAAYVFKRTGDVWGLEARLAPKDGGGSFGAAVTIEGTTVLVGAPSRTQGKLGAGQVYDFRLESGSWVEKTRITRDCYASGVGNPTCEGGAFGSAVQLVGGRAHISAPGEKKFTGVGVSPGFGAIYVFQPNGSGGFSAASPRYAVDGSWDYSVATAMRTDGTTTLATCNGRCPHIVYLYDGQPPYLDGGSAPSTLDISGDRFVLGESTGLRTYERSDDAGPFTKRELLSTVASSVALRGDQLVIASNPPGDVGNVAVRARDAGAWGMVKQQAVGFDGGASEALASLAWDGAWGVVAAAGADGAAGRVFFFTLASRLVPAK